MLNIAYNILSGGTCLEDIELLRNDEVYLDGLGAQRIPDPTTAGDFCRRLEEKDINAIDGGLQRSASGVCGHSNRKNFLMKRRSMQTAHLVETLGRVQRRNAPLVQGDMGLSTRWWCR